MVERRMVATVVGLAGVLVAAGTIYGVKVHTSAPSTGVKAGGDVTSTSHSQGSLNHRDKVFFRNVFSPQVELTLGPDPFVMKALSDKPPGDDIRVYLPVYPKAVKAPPDSVIGDIGTPMTSDLLDGAVYYTTSDSESQIEHWYQNSLAKLGYRESGQGSTGKFGKTTSTYVSFSKGSGSGLGNPTVWPQIDLGLATSGSRTTFKLKVDYIDLPTRPAGAKLPQDIVKVVLSGGGQSFTITKQNWIQSVVHEINRLKPDPPGERSCPTFAYQPGQNAPYTGAVTAEFVEQNGNTIPVEFTTPCGVRDVVVNNTHLALRGTSTLDKQINNVTGFDG